MSGSRAPAGAEAPRLPETSRPRIVDATGWPADEWDRLAARSPHGHPFQSHAWGELKGRAGWTPLRVVIELEGAPIAVAGLLHRRLARRLLGRFAPIHMYAPSGPVLLGGEELAGADAFAGAALTALRELRRREGAAILTIDPRWERNGPAAHALLASGFAPAAREIQWSRTAMIVPLRRDEQEQHALLRRSTANLVNKARRAAVVTERLDLADRGARDAALDDLYEMVAETARRVGARSQPKAVQVGQWRALADAGLATFWFASIEGRRWLGNVLLHCGAIVVQDTWGAAPAADLARVPANHLLQWDIVRWAADAGFAGYDLGGVDSAAAPGLPSGPEHPLWNLYLFKHGFGAEGVEYVPAHEAAANPLIRTAWSLARRLR